MKNKIYLILFSILSLFSCAEESNDPALVTTDDLVYVSGDRVLIQGSILSFGNANSASEHGFEISLSEEFESTIEVLLGERPGKGRFVGEISGLEPGEAYYGRAFALIDGEKITGQSLTFTTLLPSISSFDPIVANPGDLITVFGTNLPEDIEIIFGDQKGEVQQIDFNSRVIVKVPQIQEDIVVPVFVKLKDSLFRIDESFEYITGKWTLHSVDPRQGYPINLFESISLKQGNNLIFGLGHDSFRLPYEAIIEYNIPTDEWVFNDISGLKVLHPFQFDNSFGGGKSDVIYGSNNFNPVYYDYSDGLQAINEVPFNSYHAVGLELYGEKYVFGGVKDVKTTEGMELPREEILRPLAGIYKLEGNNWIDLNETVKGVQSAQIELPHFAINNIAYFIDKSGNVWTVDVATFTWERIGTFPGKVGYKGISVVSGDKAYVGLFENDPRIWEYNSITNTWKEKRKFPSASYGNNVAAEVFNGIIYVVKNPTRINFDFNQRPKKMEIWRFEPDRID